MCFLVKHSNHGQFAVRVPVCHEMKTHSSTYSCHIDVSGDSCWEVKCTAGLCMNNVGWSSESLPAAWVLWSNTFRHFKLMICVWNVHLYGSRNQRVQSFQEILTNMPSHVWLTGLCAMDGDVQSFRPTAPPPYCLSQSENYKIWSDFRILRFSYCDKPSKIVRSHSVIP